MIKEDKNILTIFKTRKYLKEKKDNKYYPEYGLETYVRTDKVKGKQ